jgi:ATP-dependent DNA helicase RecG
LKRAALLLFHPDPEKFVTGAYIKIGFFRSESDLQFQDTIHGNLFEQVEKTMEFLLTKYTRALISYKGLSRIETYEYPEDALREALLNAVAHKDYAGCTPIQIRVYGDRIKIWNEGQLPENWTVEDLLQQHSSRPYNPDIANAFFRCGYVESWGRGIEKMTEQCIVAGLPVPIITNKGSDFWITFRKDIYNAVELGLLGLSERQIKAVLYVKEKGRITNAEYQEINKCSRNTASSELNDLVNKSILQSSDVKGAGSFYQIAQIAQ